MEQVIQQLQQLNNVYAQLLTTINAQHQHLKLLIHLLQTQQQDTAASNGTNTNETLNTFALEAINNFTLSYKGFINAIKQATLSNNEAGYAISQVVLSNNEAGYTTSQAALSNNETSYPISQAALSNNEISYPISQVALPNNETGYATSQAALSNTGKQYPTNSIVEPIIDVSMVNLAKFQGRIKQIMVKCTNNSINSTSRILLELHKNPKQTHSNMIKLTGFSKGGLSKHITTLKKRGLIVRTAYQQYNLTSFTLQMMKECM